MIFHFAFKMQQQAFHALVHVVLNIISIFNEYEKVLKDPQPKKNYTSQLTKANKENKFSI